MVTVGLVHPGEMGASIGAALRERGVDVVWASEGRSAKTHARAERAGLSDVGTLAGLVAAGDVVLAICPPAAARRVAETIMRAGFGGIYVDANAIAPATASAIAELIGTPAAFVDGDLIGGPARAGGHTRMYLSGPQAPSVAALFAGSDRVDALVLEGPPESASSLKMSYAAWTKGTSALLIAIRAAARAMGVEEALLAEWAISQRDLLVRSDHAASSTAPKAWRFAGEMDEIARSFEDVGLPGQFHRGAAELYRRLAGFKGANPDIDAVLDAAPASRTGLSWGEFAAAAPELGAFGSDRLSAGPSYLATVRRGGAPRVHPVTPIIGDGHLFLFMEPTSPKLRDLQEDRSYALHNGVPDMSGTGGEFAVSGQARRVEDAERRMTAVRAASYEPAERYVLLELTVSEARSNGYGDVALPTPRRWQANVEG